MVGNRQMTDHMNSYILPNIKPLHIGNLVVDPPVLSAPMAGFTNYAFRQMVRDYGGSGLQATEMVNARGFVWMDQGIISAMSRRFR